MFPMIKMSEKAQTAVTTIHDRIDLRTMNFRVPPTAMISPPLKTRSLPLRHRRSLILAGASRSNRRRRCLRNDRGGDLTGNAKLVHINLETEPGSRGAPRASTGIRKPE
jgi:hypothetical protein